MYIYNRMKRPFTVPSVLRKDGSQTASVFILPLGFATVEDSVWKLFASGKAVKHLIKEGHLEVVKQKRNEAPKESDAANPESPKAPKDLKSDDSRVEVTSETQEIKDGPKGGRKK